MPKIYSYQKVTDKYTTYTAIDNGEEDKRIIELCTIDRDTYISVPDDLVLPKQPKQITLKPVILTAILKEKIKKASLHVQLIRKRVKGKIREKYKLEDELKIIRNKINGKELAKYDKYNEYVEGCITKGDIEKDKLL